MPIEVYMPKLGNATNDGVLTKWLKKEGDLVKEGDELAEIEENKLTATIQAYDSGKLEKILVQEGEEVPVGTVIAYISK